MAALNDREQALPQWTTERAERASPMLVEPTTLQHTRRHFPTWLSSRRFVAAAIAIGGVQLIVAMDGPVVVFALPKIQNELGLSDVGRSWVITAYMLTFGGLMLLGGRLGDTIGRKRTFIIGVALFTIASAICGMAWDGGALVSARLLHGVAAAIIAPTNLALVATTFPKGPARNAATAMFGAMSGVGGVMGLVVGGALTEVSWRLAFLVNVPIGLAVIYLARTALRETQKERMKLDATGAVLTTLMLYRGGVRLVDGPGEGLAVGHHDRFGCGGSGRFRGVRRGGAHRREPHRAVQPVLRPQPAGHVRGPVPGRWGDVHPERAGCPVCADHHGLQSAARGRRLHPVRHCDEHRGGCVVAAGDVVPAAGGGDRRRNPDAGRDAVQLDAPPRHPLLPESGAAARRRRYRLSA